MKKYSALALFCAFILTLTGCPFPNIVLQPISSSDSSIPLPSDEINDVIRAQSGAFAFETLLPVDLSLRVNLISKGSGSKELPAATVIARILDSKGNVVYTGMVNADGMIETQLQLPAAPEDMTLILTAQGFDERRIVIKDMQKLSLVKRTLAMKSKGTTSKALDASMPDTDGDGVPDVYDAFPTDPDSAFRQNIPADGALTISFEDLFGRAKAGDADYNDFLSQYKISLIKNADGGVIRLEGEALAKVKLAGYNHRFGIVIAPFSGDAYLKVTYLDANGQILPSSTAALKVSGSADITLFTKTNDSIGCTTKFTLHFVQPQTGDQIDQPPYNPYLFVYNTGHDIHLIGETPLPNSINPGDTFRDSQGFPWALLVPDTWKHPDETQRIEIPYPRFTQWRESNGTLATDWYLGQLPPPSVNTPPVAFFNDYEVTGAGSGAANGFYRENGTNQGRPRFDKVGGGMFLYFLTAADYGDISAWVIQDQIVGTLLTALYYSASNTPLPWVGAWSNMTGAMPEAGVAQISITGSAIPGETITGHYVYSDAEGDAEGATTFQWYRFSSATQTTGGTAITGATSPAYTVTSADAGGRFLRLLVTPADSRGAVGAPVFSAPTRTSST